MHGDPTDPPSAPSPDVTEHESIYQSLLGQVPGVLYVAETGWNGRWLYISPQIEALLGFPVQEWLDDPTLWFRQLHPDDRDAEMAAERPDVTAPGQTHYSEYRLTSNDGRVHWFRDAATLVPNDVGPGFVWSGVLTDITEQRRAEEGLRQSQADTAAIIETAMDAYVAVDGEGRIVEWNRAAETIFGWSAAEVVGRNLAETIVPPLHRAAHSAGFARALEGTATPMGGRAVEITGLRSDGSEVDVELTLWRTPSGQGRQFSAFLRDITDRTALRERLTHQAHHDPVTGLANRHLLGERLDQALSPSNAVRGTAVLFIDLDDFKSVNDTMGHAIGDLVLTDVAARLSTCLRGQDTLARLSGDEFAVLLPDLMSPDEALTIAQRLQAALDEPIVLGEREWFVQASIGVAHRGPGSPTGAGQLMADADLAMYAGKRRGQGQVTLFTQRMRTSVERRSRLTTDLHQALERADLTVHYQPLVDLTDGAVVGVEALARWQRGPDEWIPPAEFVPLAEGTGLIRRLGEQVLLQACRDVVTLNRQRPGLPALGLAVNVSPRQLDDPGFTDRLAAVLRTTGLPAPALTLEITEGALVEDTREVIGRLSALRDIGVRIAVDDFGTHFASLAYLQRLPLDILKVDRAFVAGVHAARGSAPITSAIVRMARELGLRTVGEGIEDAAEAHWLREIGCDLGQGYHFGRPTDMAGLVEAMGTSRGAELRRGPLRPPSTRAGRCRAS